MRFLVTLANFKFNKVNGRLIKTYTSGYYNVLPEDSGITDKDSDHQLWKSGSVRHLNL